MFDSCSQFVLTAKNRFVDNGFDVERYVYSFKTKKNNKYVFYADCYGEKLFFVKFFLKSHKNSENKFCLKTNKHETIEVVSTCFKIILHLFKQDNECSFAFLATRFKDEDSLVPRRFLVYLYLLENKVSGVNFEHKTDKANVFIFW